ILVVAHLYNAAHQSGLLSKYIKWADLDWFISQQGSDWMFVGERPKEDHQFYKRLKLAMGF
ncbi:hypothetical protein BKA66DRAFT_386244, partial [Pyrenochaeta sp. MPI-SDFR-AT-0127]